MIIQRAIGDWVLGKTKSCEGARNLYGFRVNLGGVVHSLVMRGPQANEITLDLPAFRFPLISTAPHGDPTRVRFKMAGSVVVTIPRLRRVCKDRLARVAGAALADRVNRDDELLDRVSLIHLTPRRYS